MKHLTFRKVTEAGRCVMPLLVFLVAWELGSLAVGSDTLPGVVELSRLFVTHALSDPIIRSQGGGDYGFLPHVAATLIRVAVGVGTGASVGVIAAMLLFQWPAFRQAVEPLLEALRVVPPLILIPFVLVVLGPTETAQVTVCALYAALSMLVHTLNAVANLPREFWIICRVHRASRWQTIRTMAWPAALPELLGGIRISLAVALGIVIVSEYLGAPNGIGRVLKFALSFARVDLTLVGLIWGALIGVLLDAMVSRAIIAQNRWRD